MCACGKECCGVESDGGVLLKSRDERDEALAYLPTLRFFQSVGFGSRYMASLVGLGKERSSKGCLG